MYCKLSKRQHEARAASCWRRATDIKQILSVKERREMLRGLARDNMDAVMKAGPVA